MVEHQIPKKLKYPNPLPIGKNWALLAAFWAISRAAGNTYAPTVISHHHFWFGLMACLFVRGWVLSTYWVLGEGRRGEWGGWTLAGRIYILTISNLPTCNPSLVGLRSNLVLLLYMAFYLAPWRCNHSHSLEMGNFFNFVIILLIIKQDDPNLDEMGN
jgi:hypothetical protein